MPTQFKDINKQSELIDKIPYLKDFHKEDKATLSRMAYFMEYEEGEIIIEQNSVNQELYFLIRGKVEVIKDGEHIVDLRGGGRLFGEMSYMNHSFTTATVRAKTNLVMMCFRIPGLLALELDKYARLQVSLYKAIAEILCEKLVATTELAKTFQQNAHSGQEQVQA